MEVKLTSIPIFAGLSEPEIEKLLSAIVFQRKSYSKNALIVSHGEVCDRLLILIKGTVKGEMLNLNGKSLKIEDMSAPSLLASAFIFGEKAIFPVNIVTSTDVCFLVIQKNELLKLFRLSDKVLQNFLGLVSSKARFISEKLRFHSFKNLRIKLANYLIAEAGNNNNFKLKHTQSELAELFGVARPSVGRAFLHLQEDEIIDIRYKQVKIINQQRLIEACNE